MQPRYYCRMHMLGNHEIVAKIESGRINAASEHFHWISKICAIVGDWATAPQDSGGTTMSKRSRKKRDRKNKGANHGRRPNS